jgi:hypothetical protein
MSGPLYLHRIEVDGHMRGGPPVKPWAALITGTDPKYGLAREFVQAMNDWADAHRAWSGNLYGVVATFPLRSGGLYEIQSCRGKPSKRHVYRGFYVVERNKLREIEPLDALAIADGGGEAALFRVAEREPYPSVTELETVSSLGFVLLDGERIYRLRAGVYRVRDCDGVRMVRSSGQSVRTITRKEASEWLATV